MKKVLLLSLICAVITFNTACSKPSLPQNTNTGSTQTENVDKTETEDPKDAVAEKPEAGSQTEEKAEVKPETEEKAEANQEKKPEVKPGPKPVTKPQPKPETKPQPKPETKPETKPEPETKPSDSILNGDLKDIIQEIYAKSELKLAETEFKEVSSNPEYFIGTNNVEFTEGIASEPLINIVTHSLVLLRVDKNSDIDKIKAEIKSKANPRKWVCVGVEEDDVVVDSIDNLIILIMDRESEKLHGAFLSLAK